MMRRAILALCVIGAAGAVAVPAAHADNAVLKSGLRLHITGYERMGDIIRLTILGGEVTIPAGDLVAVEPEDIFEALPAAKSVRHFPFGNLIHAAAAKHGLDENLLALVIAQESNFDPKAVSRRKARGLMQLMPRTAAELEVMNVLDPAQNIDAGAHYLRELLDRYGGNLSFALAAYNAGPEMVDRYGGIPPFPETQRYVRRITTQLKDDKKIGL